MFKILVHFTRLGARPQGWGRNDGKAHSFNILILNLFLAYCQLRI